MHFGTWLVARRMVVLAILGMMSVAHAQLEFLRQSGQISVSGQLGTFTETAPPDRPWSTVVNAGSGGPIWFAQASAGTFWNPRSINAYPEALVDPGNGPSLLTQSLMDVSIAFRVTQPTTVLVTFVAGPNQVGPGMPIDEYRMELFDVANQTSVLSGQVNLQPIFLPGGDFELHVSNRLGNTLTNLTLPSGARMLAVRLLAVLPGDANLDQVVDEADFRIWNAHKFSSGTNWFFGDFNGDRVTDGLDFGIWNAHKIVRPDDVRPVPEPTVSLAVASLAVIGLASRRRAVAHGAQAGR